MKGQKTGGRQKGTPNKATKEIRDFFSNFFNENKELFMNDLLSLEPLQRLSILPKILPFVMPKPQAEPENNEPEPFQRHDPQNRFLNPSLDVWRNMADNIRRSMHDDTEEQQPLEGTPFSPFVTSDTISDCNTIPYNDNGQHPQTSDPSDPSNSFVPSNNSVPPAPSAPSVPSELSDPSDPSDNLSLSDYSDYSDFSDYSNPSNNPVPSDPSELSDPSDSSELSDNLSPSDFSDYSAPSDPSDSSDSSDSSNNPTPSNPSPKPSVPRTPFYKALDLKKTHNKRRKRR